MSDIRVVRPGETRKRVKRQPNFPVAGVLKPFGLYPIMVHPVLPGETLEFAQSKIRVISKPVKHPLVGAWLEHWFVYVKFTDIDRTLGDMFITDSYSTAGRTIGADNLRFFTKSGRIDWIGMCVRRIHDAYFRHSGEAMRTIDSVPLCKLNAMSWYQNCIYEEAVTAPSGTSIETLEGQISAFDMMRQMAMTEVTYERYLQQYGVSSVKTGIGEPEILRYARSWTQPVNSVEPTTGTPSSAWVWSDDVKIEKNKRFEEPGFIVQLACVRPKMFPANINSSMIGNMWGFSDWFPAYNLEDPQAGAKILTQAESVVTGAGTGAMIYDHRDLLNHGEPFVNTVTDHPFALPLASVPNHAAAQNHFDLRGEYATSANVDSLFAGAGATDKWCYYEGLSSLGVLGHVADYT